jgi:hypothetical protein
MTFFGGFAPVGANKIVKAILGVSASLAVMVAAAAPAQAAGTYGGAEKLRRLDIMLMVTSLRCRTGSDNFQAEYQNFTANHLQELNQANDELRQNLANQVGSAGSARALDRISTVMANAYGQGHPWLSCGELKSVTSDLAQASGRPTLEEAADQLLGDGRTVELAYARR